MNKEELITLSNSNIFYKKPLEETYFDMLEKLMDITLEANEKFNLTAIKEKDKFRELMIYDSLLPLKYCDFDNKSVLDVGTGAGFPGLPLAICSNGSFTLLDSTNKKIRHLCCVSGQLGIKNVTPICARAEEFAKEHRASFDYVIARAVAPLNVLSELCLPLIKVGGTFVAMKGSRSDEELSRAKNMIKMLGGEVIDIKELSLPESKEQRTLIFVKKAKATPKKYPRAYADIVGNNK